MSKTVLKQTPFLGDDVTPYKASKSLNHLIIAV